MGRKALTKQEVELYCESQGYRLLSPYVKSKIKIILQNIETNEIGEMRFDCFKQGRRFDTKNPIKFTQQEVEEYCLERGYKLLTEYADTKTKIKLQNIKTNIIGEMTFNDFKAGCRFDNPRSSKKLTYKQYIQPFADESYTVLLDEKDYKNVTVITKITVTCPNNHQWDTTRNKFTSNRRCPMCNKNVLGGMSTGERMVYQLLQGNNINFEREKSVYIDGNNYRFDFYFEVKSFSYTDKFIIEYDGIQHYREGSGYLFGGLKQRRESDEIKDKYARDNNIQMVRIAWTNDTIDKILFVINGETGLNLKKVDVDLPSIQEVSDYYLNHTLKETSDEFNISVATTTNYFNQIYGTCKAEYLGVSIGAPKQQAVDYYLSHTLKETIDKFNISNTTMLDYFKQIHGMSKKEYLSTSE